MWRLCLCIEFFLFVLSTQLFLLLNSNPSNYFRNNILIKFLVFICLVFILFSLSLFLNLSILRIRLFPFHVSCTFRLLRFITVMLCIYIHIFSAFSHTHRQKERRQMHTFVSCSSCFFCPYVYIYCSLSFHSKRWTISKPLFYLVQMRRKKTHTHTQHTRTNKQTHECSKPTTTQTAFHLKNNNNNRAIIQSKQFRREISSFLCVSYCLFVDLFALISFSHSIYLFDLFFTSVPLCLLICCVAHCPFDFLSFSFAFRLSIVRLFIIELRCRQHKTIKTET